MSGAYVSNTNPICERCKEESSYVEVVYDSKNCAHQFCWNCYRTYLEVRDKTLRDFTDNYVFGRR